MSANLPEHLFRSSIRDMLVGEQAYTVPWSVQVDQDGKCWIRGDYAFTHKPFGTSRMPVKRTGDGFEVQISRNTQYDQAQISSETKSQMGLLPITKVK